MAPSLKHEDYTVGMICALPIETAAATGMLDERHSSLPQSTQDSNQYTLGRIGAHNIVIACLPAGILGTTSAANVAFRIQFTFPSLRFGLLVGIGGGAPSGENDVRLGDVVISKPTGRSGGVIQYDLGKTIQGRSFETTGSLNRPPDVLLSAVSNLQTKHLIEESEAPKHLERMFLAFPKLRNRGTFPGREHDKLFEAEYEHPSGIPTCDTCDDSRLVKRSLRDDDVPRFHYGLVASGNQVMRNGIVRDRLRKEHNVLCFEMEAAGLMDAYPCLVIRGISDYSDSHKCDVWQPYAAMTAAACAKEILYSISADQVACTPAVPESVSKPVKLIFSVPFPRDKRFIGRESIFLRIQNQLETDHSVSLCGLGGIGKSQIAIEYAYRHRSQNPRSHIFWVYAANRTRFLQAFQEIAQSLKLPGHEDQNTDHYNSVSKWLDEEETVSWLIILDSADDGEVFFPKSEEAIGEMEHQSPRDTRPLFEYLPKKLNAQKGLIVTSRDRHVGENLTSGNPCIDVPPFSSGESRELLYSRLRRQENLSDETDIEELLDTLGNIPLAINQAAAFIHRNKMPLKRYRAALERDQQSLIEHLSKELQDHRRELGTPNSIFRTWKLSFDQIRAQEPETAKLLSVMAMLDRQRIPRTLVHSVVEKELDFFHAIGTLDGFSLVSRELEEDVFSIHRLVQISVHQWLELEQQKVPYMSLALKTVEQGLPDPLDDHKGLFEMCFPHTQTVFRFHFTSDEDKDCFSNLHYNVAHHFFVQEKYARAFTLFLSSYWGREELSRGLVPLTSDPLSFLDKIMYSQGKFKKTKNSLQQSRTIGENFLLEQPRMCENVLEFALAMHHCVISFMANNICRRAIGEFSAELGPNHLYTLICIKNCAHLLHDLGDYQDFSKMYLQALEHARTAKRDGNPESRIGLIVEEIPELSQQVLQESGRITKAKFDSLLVSLEKLANALRDPEQPQGQGSEKNVHSESTKAEFYSASLNLPKMMDDLRDPGLPQGSENNVSSKPKELENVDVKIRSSFDKLRNVLRIEQLCVVKNVIDFALTLESRDKLMAWERWGRAPVKDLRKAGEFNVLPNKPSICYVFSTLCDLERYDHATTFYFQALFRLQQALGDEHSLVQRYSAEMKICVIRAYGSRKTSPLEDIQGSGGGEHSFTVIQLKGLTAGMMVNND